MRAILTYHSIDDSGSVISVSPERFASQVRWLASGAVDVVSVPDLLALPPDRAAVAITFDDAFRNFASAAWPLLRDAGIPVTLFVPTGHVGKTNHWAATPGGAMPTMPLLGWDELARIAAEGVRLGAHTRTHPDLRTLAAAAIVDEVAGSVADILGATGQRADGFAYPYGYHDARVLGATRSLCDWAVTTVLARVAPHPDAHCLPRLDAYFLNGPGRLEGYGSLRFRGYMGLRAVVRRARGK